MWKNINFKNNQIMNQNPSYTHYAAIFAQEDLLTLIANFNRQVGLRGFNSERAAHDVALIHEFIRRGLDVSAIYDGTTISFANCIAIDADGEVFKL